MSGSRTRLECGPAGPQRAFDMPALHIFKIWGGQIHEIEAVGVTGEYNSPTGWE